MLKILIRATEAVVPKVSGGLACIEEEIKESQPNLTVKQLAPEFITIDGTIILCQVNQRWQVGNAAVAEIHCDVEEEVTADGLPVDCTLTINDKCQFAGSIDEWYAACSKLLEKEIQNSSN